MKQIFTKFSLVFICVCLAWGLSAQSVLEITEPAEVAGTYNLGNSEFYFGCVFDVTGEMVIAEPNEACTPITTDLSGKIAVIDRGSCSFKSKALNAQDVGAIAVLICNNLPMTDDNGGAIVLGDDPGLEEDVTIPTLSLSQEDCNIFKSLLPLTGTITVIDQTQNVLWGDQPGQGDFDGGLNGWTATTIECNGIPSDFNVWQWSEDGTASRGSFISDRGPISSPTRCNGAMAFDSDFYDNNGDAVDPTTGENISIAFGSGPCPANQIGELISPVIDISSADVSSVGLSFYQYARQFNSSFLVGYSLDGGSTWTDIPVNTEVGTNDETPPGEFFQFVPLPGAAGADNLRIRFRMDANYYFWIVDDVKIVEGFLNDLEVTSFFYTPASAVQPAAVIEHDPFSFSAEVINRGAAMQTDIRFLAAVERIDELDNGDIEFVPVHVDSSFYDTLAVGDTLVATIDSLWNPDVGPGAYRITYLITQGEEEEDLPDNSQFAFFSVSESLFSKDLNNGNDATRDNDGLAHSYANLYSIPAEVEEDFVLEQIIFRTSAREADGPLAGNSINAYLLQTNSEAVESVQDLDLSTTDLTFGDQMEFVGFAEYTFPDDAEQDGIFATALEDFDTGDSRIPLAPGTGYAAVIEYPEESSFLLQSYSTDIAYISERGGFLSGLLLRDRWYTGFQGQNGFAPVIRMALALATSVDDTPLPDGTMSVFPNPATDYVQAQFNFETPIDATITLATMEGKVITFKNQSLLNDVVDFNTSNLAEGMYLLRVATEIGTKTEKFLVQHP